MKYLTCVYEDELTASIIKRLFKEFESDIAISTEINAHGFGRIKKSILNYNRAARHTAFFIVTDLDQKECAASLIKDWFCSVEKEPQLLFRIAVHEIDAWVLADKTGIAKLLNVSSDLIPQEPESILDPKNLLMQLAKKSKSREIREDFPPKDKYAHQGPLYNILLTSFVKDNWDLYEAMQHSESLTRAYTALKKFAKS